MLLPEDIEKYLKPGIELRIRYVSKKGIESVKMVYPVEIRSAGGFFYLTAVDRCGRKLNEFRLDRIKAVREVVSSERSVRRKV